jgi:hypothetical protein
MKRFLFANCVHDQATPAELTVVCCEFLKTIHPQVAFPRGNAGGDFKNPAGIRAIIFLRNSNVEKASMLDPLV